MPSSEVFDKFKAGTLHSGGPGGPKVTSRAQAIAIKMSEERNEDEHGGHYQEGGKKHKHHRSTTRLGKM